MLFGWIIEQLKERDRLSGVPFLKNYIRASGAGQCLRKRKYAQLHTEATEEKNINSLLTVNFGNIFHLYIQEVLQEKFGLHFIAEKRLYNPQLKITGAFDGIIYDTDSDSFYLIDIKTTHPKKKEYLEKQQSADENHIKQLAVYNYLLRHAKDTYILDINNKEAIRKKIEDYPLLHAYREADKAKIKGVVLYIARDAIFFYEYPVDFYSDRVKGLLKKELQDIKLIREVNKPESLNKTQNGWECKYCPYVSLCEGVVNAKS